MIFKNTRVLYFMLLIFFAANIFSLISYGYISIFVICFEVLLVSLYIIFRPIKIHIDKTIIVYYLLPKRFKEISSNQVVYIEAYRQGTYGGGGYLIKLKYLDMKGKRKTITLLESISENDKDQIVELIKSYDFKVKND